MPPGLPGERAGDQLVAGDVVIEHPGCKPDGRILDRVQGLGAIRHLVRVPDACREEVLEDVEGAVLFGRQARGLRPATGERLGDVRWHGRRHVRMDAEQAVGLEQRHLLGHGVSPVAALGDVPARTRGAASGRPRPWRCGSGPSRSSVGFPEKPWPGRDGMTRWNASAALASCAVGSVSGSMSFSCSTVEPGQPCVTIRGSASSCFERTWMKWMSTPSISVMKCGKRREARLERAPVVLARPVASQGLDRLEPYALTGVGLTVGPARVGDPLTQVVELPPAVRRSGMVGSSRGSPDRRAPLRAA